MTSKRTFSLLCRVWGILGLSLGFMWQLYALWILTQLHESESGVRYSRYLQLSLKAFGETSLSLSLCDRDHDMVE